MTSLLLAALLTPAHAAEDAPPPQPAPASATTTLSTEQQQQAEPVPTPSDAMRRLEQPPAPPDGDADGLPDSVDPCPRDATNVVTAGRCPDGTAAVLAPAPEPTAETPAVPAPTLTAPADPSPATTPEAPVPPSAPSGPPAPLTLADLRAAAEVVPLAPMTLDHLKKNAEVPPTFQRLKKWLEPSPGHLPARPRGQVDYTAYVLEWGELKLGLANMAVGVLPHVQVGTSPPLLAARVPNVTAKIDATSDGLFDVSAQGSYYSLPRGVFEGTYITAGGTTSFSFGLPGTRARFVSAHLGANYAWLQTNGALDFSTIGELVTGRDLEPGTLVASAALTGETVTARAALDLRLNRRDTFILQASSTVYARSEANDNVTAAFNFLSLDDALRYDGIVPPTENYVASLAWHLAWEHLEARIGVGTSSVPGAWLLQTTELSWRFFGSSRMREARQRRTFKKNEQLERKPQAPASP
jgi:hypothetical protein